MILVTGGTGLLGSHLLFKLASVNSSVCAIRRPTSDLSLVKKVFANNPSLLKNIDWKECDILDVETLNEVFHNVEYVYHCAAMISFAAHDVDMMLKVNAEGTANIVNLCLQWNVKKLCHASSVAALGRSYDGEHINEDTPWRNSKANTNYALSKYAAEREAWRGIAEGLETIIVNPSIILGPGQWHENGGALIKYVYDGKPFYPRGRTGFVDVRDVADCMIMLMNSEISAERFVFNSQNLTYKEVMDWTAESFNMKKPNFRINNFLSGVGWRLEKLKSVFTQKTPLITMETARTAGMKYYYSNEKIKQAVGIKFRPVRETIQWVCENFIDENK